MKLKKFKNFLLTLLRDECGWSSEMNVTGVAEIDEAIPEFWAEGIITDGSRESFWSQLAGKEGSMLPLIDKTGPLKQKGDLLIFNTIEHLMGSGVTGENVLKGQEEKLGIGSFTVTADIVRHAVAVSRKSTKQANFDEVKNVRTLLKDWFARKLDGDVFTSIKGSSVVSTIYAGDGNTAIGHLNETDGDYFGPTEINMIRMALIRQGALPLKTKKTNGRTIPFYGIVYGEMEEYYLNQNTAFWQTVKEAWERFKGGNDDHPLFAGAVGVYRNMLLYPYYSMLPIPQGTALRPETTISATFGISEVDTLAVGVAGDSNALANYTLYFASSGSLQIEDEIVSYTGKTISTFTGLTRSVSSTTAVEHAAGVLVTERDVATVIGFGAQGIYRAFPEQAEPIGEKDDFGEQIGLGIRAYYGHGIRIDKRRAKSPSLVMCKVISPNPGNV